jgi:hypothetical protein
VRPAGVGAAGTSREGSLTSPGRPWGRSAAYLWRGRWDTAGLLLRRANDGERGNHLVLVPGGRASGPLAGIGAPTAERAGWGGAAVVLRAEESPAHGEGRQRYREGKEEGPGQRPGPSARGKPLLGGWACRSKAQERYLAGAHGQPYAAVNLQCPSLRRIVHQFPDRRRQMAPNKLTRHCVGARLSW